MAIKAGQILHAGNNFVIDRIQTGGVSNLNIPEEKIYELGNYASVANVRDIPEVTFDLESLDVSPEIEALLIGDDPTALVDGDEIDLSNHMPLDIISPFKAGGTSYAITSGIVVPYLTLESATWRYGVGQNATKQFSLRTDGVLYIEGSPYTETHTLVNNTLTYTFANTALAYTEGGDTFYALSACVKNPTTKVYKRLFLGVDYTNTNADITLLEDQFDEGYTQLHVTYGSATAATYNASVHQNVSVKPAAVKGKDIVVRVSDGAATPTLTRWSGVQSAEVTRRVTLENDQEFDNQKYVGSDYDVPEVSGNIVVKSVDPADLFDKIAQITNTTSAAIHGLHSSQALEVEIEIHNPETAVTEETIYIPDARFLPPATQGRVQTKLEATFPFTSDSGVVKVYKGERP